MPDISLSIPMEYSPYDAEIEEFHSAKKRKIVEFESTEENCMICVSLILEKDLCQLDECFHQFCFGCISQWIRVTPTCPLCKISVKFGYITTPNGSFRRIRLGHPESPNQKWEKLSGLDFRKRIYSQNSNRKFSPIFFKNTSISDLMQRSDVWERMEPFLRRELLVLTNQNVFDVVESLIRSRLAEWRQVQEEIVEMFPEHGLRLLDELESFARSGLTVSAFDLVAKYE